MTTKAHLQDVIDFTSEKDIQRAESFLSIGIRANNPKRKLLFINKLLGKHYPVNARMVFDHFDEVFSNTIPFRLRNKSNKILIIGFAETATALASYLKIRFLTEATLVFTTRYQRDKDMVYLPFSEDHSHAPNQWLALPKDLDFSQFDTVLYVDDEISTGNTVLNLREVLTRYNELVGQYDHKVVSVLNFQSELDKLKMSTLGIEMLAYVNGTIKIDLNSYPSFIDQSKLIFPSNTTTIEQLTKLNNEANYRTHVYDKCVMRHCIVGFEDEMYGAIVEASDLILDALNDYDDVDVKTHSTTRSPIMVSIDPSMDYDMQSVVSVPSENDPTVTTYLYNVDRDYKYRIVKGD